MGFEDWDQRLFGWIWRGTRGIGKRLRQAQAGQNAGPPAHAVTLEEVAPKLRLLGAALTGVSIDIREAERAAGYRGDTIFLPGIIALDSREQGAQAYLLALAYQATSKRLGLRLPSSSTHPEVASLLGMRVILPQLLDALPGMRALIGELREPLMKARTSLDSLQGAALALESALYASLERPVEGARDEHGWSKTLEDAAKSMHDGPATSRDKRFGDACTALTKSLAKLGGPVEAKPLLPFGLLRDAAPTSPPGATMTSPELVPAAKTEREGKSREAVRQVQLDDRPLADNPLVHSFEKVHTAEEYTGGQKALDGTDELDDHLDALQELDLREVIRTRERTHSILRADALLEGAAPELHDATPERPPDYVYDEWDGRRGEYRKDHCNLYLEKARPVRAEAAARWVKQTRVARRQEIKSLERELAKIALQRRPTPRQRDGSEVDLDAVVAAHATLAAGHTPSDRLFVRHRRKDPTLSILLLIDMSLSSDSYVAGERIIDISRESAFIVGEAIGDAMQLGIAGFHSNTRRDCRFVTVKGFDERWQQVRGRLVGLEPRGYTRIGPAIRHGANALRNSDSRRRVLLVISDGQPTDYDRYEGRHGVQDVQQAVREAKRDAVHCFSLAVSSERRPQLAQMFGADRYALLQKGSQLPVAMGEILTEIVRG